MGEWYVKDVLGNVTGPHEFTWVVKKAGQMANFWVTRHGDDDWSPVEKVLLTFPGSVLPSREEVQAGNTTLLLERGINELIGLCKGIIADGRVDPNEAIFLKSWLETNADVANVWPANVLNERVNQIFLDGVVDEQEQLDLQQLLAKFTGGVPGGTDAEPFATRLPVDDPLPDVVFEGKSFCLTGKFIMGAKEKCKEIILGKGGKNHRRPEMETDYLVIGALGSPHWSHSTHGWKVEQVLKNRDQGAKTIIVSEEHWTFFLDPRLTPKSGE